MNQILLALGGIVTAGSVILLLSILILHLLPTGYNPLKNAVSDYGVGKYRVLHRISALSRAAAGFALAIASSGTVKLQSRLVVVLLVIFAVAMVVINFFPTDIEEQFTTKGRVHWALAGVAFASLGFAAGFYKGTALDDAAGWFVAVAVILLLLSLLPRFRKALPVLERTFFLSMICWFLVTGVELIQLSLQ
jgi:hypothetical membrane protein